MEDAEAVANAFEEGGEEISELTQALEDVQSAIEEVAAEYREADDNFGGTGGTESGMKADDLESVYLDASFEEFDAGTVLEGDDLEAAQADWRAEQAQILRDALEEIPV
jgi:exonuclease VII small subunit